MKPQHSTRGLRSRTNLIWLAAYAAMLVTILAAMFQGRQSTLAAFDTPEARAQWQAWREAEPNTSDQGPVKSPPPISHRAAGVAADARLLRRDA